MNDVMLFGEGWNGEVIKNKQKEGMFSYKPNRPDPKLGEVTFRIFPYHSDIDRNYYLVALFLTLSEPLAPDVEKAILKYKPKPTPI